MPEIQNVRFVVNETPYCYWDLEIQQQNLKFIRSIDPNYFEHVAILHDESLESKEKQYAAAALRIAYSHGLESLLALLCATVQAPDCIIGWLLKYQNSELHAVVEKIHQRKSIYSKLKTKTISWDIVAELIFTNLKTGDDNKDISIRNNFARLWRHFASDFLKENHSYEYNSIKHGLRAKMGGFTLAMGVENDPGVPAPPERMHTVGSSQFGSSFFIPKRLFDRRNFTVKHRSLNWNPQNYIYALHLISMSINNVLGFLKIINGIPANEIQFLWAKDDEIYKEPWKRNAGISSMGWDSVISEEMIIPLSEKEIIAAYDENEKS